VAHRQNEDQERQRVGSTVLKSPRLRLRLSWTRAVGGPLETATLWTMPVPLVFLGVNPAGVKMSDCGLLNVLLGEVNCTSGVVGMVLTIGVGVVLTIGVVVGVAQ